MFVDVQRALAVEEQLAAGRLAYNVLNGEYAPQTHALTSNIGKLRSLLPLLTGFTITFSMRLSVGCMPATRYVFYSTFKLINHIVNHHPHDLANLYPHRRYNTRRRVKRDQASFGLMVRLRSRLEIDKLRFQSSMLPGVATRTESRANRKLYGMRMAFSSP
jgi:hypothetical protein